MEKHVTSISEEKEKRFNGKKTAAESLILIATKLHNKGTANEEDFLFIKSAIFRLQQQDDITNNEVRKINELLRDVTPAPSRKQKAMNMIVGQNPEFLKAIGLIEKYSKNTFGDGSSDVLILGETGVGKELIAIALHQHSSRSTHPLISVNCAGLSETLVEDTFFGHEKGAFTGANKKEVGIFEAAEGGTVFLDEIGELTPKIQAKLLRVVSERTLIRIGGTKQIPVDVVIITASNRDLHKMVKEESFREDLFYRLNTLPIVVPPLRTRKNDIPLLANHFLEKYKNQTGNDVLTIDPNAMIKLCSHHWPGNVRELDKVIIRAAKTGNGRIINAKDIDLDSSSKMPGVNHFMINLGSLKNMQDQFKEIAAKVALRIYDGNNSKLSKELLECQRTYFSRIKKRFGIEDSDWEDIPLEQITGGIKFNFQLLDKYAEVVELEEKLLKLSVLFGLSLKQQTRPERQRVLPEKDSADNADKCSLVTNLVIEQNNGLVSKAWSNNKKDFIKGGIKTKSALLRQIRKYGLRESCEQAKTKKHIELIVELVIKKNNGLVSKSWNKHSEQFIANEINTRGDLNYRIRSNKLSEKCKQARLRYYKKVITAKLLKKHNNNFVKIASELVAPRTEVCKFCANKLKPK